jgi:hypothetical protein
MRLVLATVVSVFALGCIGQSKKGEQPDPQTPTNKIIADFFGLTLAQLQTECETEPSNSGNDKAQVKRCKPKAGNGWSVHAEFVHDVRFPSLKGQLLDVMVPVLTGINTMEKFQGMVEGMNAKYGPMQAASRGVYVSAVNFCDAPASCFEATIRADAEGPLRVPSLLLVNRNADAQILRGEEASGAALVK